MEKNNVVKLPNELEPQLQQLQLSLYLCLRMSKAAVTYSSKHGELIGTF